MTTLTDNVNKNSKTKQTKNKRFAVKGFFPAIGRQPRPLPAPPQVLATSVRSVTFDTVFSLSWSRGGGGVPLSPSLTTLSLYPCERVFRA